MATLVVVCVTAAGCASFQTHLDVSGIDDLAEHLSAPADLGQPAALHAWLSSPLRALEPLPSIVAGGPTRGLGGAKPSWSVSLADGTKVIPRILHLPAAVSRTDQGPDAVFYLYSPVLPSSDRASSDRVILWAPGMGVSDFALHFIDRFLIAALERGWSVLLWVPPYHLERRARDRDAGEGLFVPNPLADLRLIHAGSLEIRAGRRWLLRHGARRVGGWGGSMGAAMLLLAATAAPFDHLSLMIPVLDWRTITVDQPRMAAVVAAWRRAGYSPGMLRRAFARVSPMDRPLRLPSRRVQLLYGRLDQLTPEATSLRWARQLNGATGEVEVHGYDRSHATILLSRQLFEDYHGFLTRMTPSPGIVTGSGSRASSP